MVGPTWVHSRGTGLSGSKPKPHTYLVDTLASSLLKQLKPEFSSAAISGSHPWEKAVWRSELQACLVVKPSSLEQGWQACGVSFPGPPLAC